MLRNMKRTVVVLAVMSLLVGLCQPRRWQSRLSKRVTSPPSV